MFKPPASTDEAIPDPAGQSGRRLAPKPAASADEAEPDIRRQPGQGYDAVRDL